MSRIGKLPVPVPAKVALDIDGRDVKVKGPLGELKRTFRGVTFKHDGAVVNVVPDSQSRTDRALWGLGRTLLNNMIVGVEQGFSKALQIQGIGYRAEAQGDAVIFSLGFSHPINFKLPAGISVDIKNQTLVTISGVDKEMVGQTAAKIRALRPPEPYKGKGVRYADEYIQRKAGKQAK